MNRIGQYLKDILKSCERESAYAKNRTAIYAGGYFGSGFEDVGESGGSRFVF